VLSGGIPILKWTLEKDQLGYVSIVISKHSPWLSTESRTSAIGRKKTKTLNLMLPFGIIKKYALVPKDLG
jgi:hypothetical protein